MRINVYCLEIVPTGEVFYVGATSKPSAKVENKWIEHYGLTKQRKSAYSLKSYRNRLINKM